MSPLVRRFARLPRRTQVRLLGVAGLGVALLVGWAMCVHYVPPGKVLVVVKKNGEPLPPGQILADAGQKGIQKRVLAEGWHFVWPVVNATELRDAIQIPAGKVGVVTNVGGTPAPSGTGNAVLVDGPDAQGIRRQVLLPGTYRMNPHGFKVEVADAVEIRPGYVGVVRRLLGKDNAKRYADAPEDKGLMRAVLPPGLYCMNNKEYEVLPREVGIFQTTYSTSATPQKGRLLHQSITFPARDGNTITLEATIEWEVPPDSMPDIVADFGTVAALEENVIDQQARKISRDRGFNYGAQDFLDGGKREKFQTDFAGELKEVCKRSHVVVRSAFIRHIAIPEDFLKLQRDRVISTETKLTSEAKRQTADSDALVEEAKQLIAQAEQKVKADTQRLVATIDREVENLVGATDSGLEAMKAKYAAQIAELDGQRRKAVGVAEAEARRMKQTAEAGLTKLQAELFRDDSEAFLRYTLAESLNPSVSLRLFQAGPGTLWTNLDGGKGLQFMMPTANGNAKPESPVAATGPRREVLPRPRE